ncbi:hypothetical protein CQW23_14562 [Capsicum baccatum]|uniref:Uncharacterized protein n=1 Tax=Capsicum baccatum TaxID=33114 RepID=A0A2G2WJI6_CAPBA|nr:hypothetical protein CQW23_14562 [Capsicum baccatum]
MVDFVIKAFLNEFLFRAGKKIVKGKEKNKEDKLRPSDVGVCRFRFKPLSRTDNLIIGLTGQDLKRLRKLDLSFNDMLLDKELISMLVSCNNLNELKVRGCKKLTNLAVVSLAKCCERLQSVDVMYCCGMDAQGVEFFVLNSPNLRLLHVEGNKDWLRSESQPISIEEDLDSLEQLEQGMKGMKRVYSRERFQPLPKTVALVEDIVVDYVTDMDELTKLVDEEDDDEEEGEAKTMQKSLLGKMSKPENMSRM